MRTTMTHGLAVAVAAALLTVPLVPQPARARPDPGTTPTATSRERPDGFDPGWETYSYRAPEPGRSEGGRAGVAPDRTADLPGGSVYGSQVPPQAWATPSPTRSEVDPEPRSHPRHARGDSVYRSQVPPEAWDS